MRTTTKVALAILLAAALAWASDPWKDKSYQQWDQKDISKVLNNSPWVKRVSVNADWRPGEAPMTPHPRTQPGAEPGQGPVMPGQSPETPGEPPTMAQAQPNQATFEARWLSSRTIREALVRMQELNGKTNQASAEQYLAQQPPDYQVVVFGPDMTPFQDLDEATLAKDAYLEMKGSKQRIAASQVKIEHGQDSRQTQAVTFSFPKTANAEPTIGESEKSVGFVCQIQGMILRFNFDPQKMTDKQGRDL